METNIPKETREQFLARRDRLIQSLDEKLNGPPKDEAEMTPAERPSNTPVFEQMRESDEG